MAEQITFTAPLDPPKTVFRIALLAFDWLNSTITIHLREFNPNGDLSATPPIPFFGERTVVVLYTGTIARTLMNQLNTINLSTAGNSLHQRIMTRLLADGKIPAGAGSGAPD